MMPAGRTLTTALGRLAVLLGATVVVVSLAGPVLAAEPHSQLGDPGWEIRSFHADIDVRADGSILVVEHIEVDFRDLPSRGIFREIPIRQLVDDTTVRRFDLRDVEVSTSGAPDDVQRTTTFETTTIRVGDPDVYIIGAHTYVISYVYDGVLNRFDSHDELFWNVTGDHWEPVIGSASARVTAPEGAIDVQCFAGRTGETNPCGSARIDGDAAEFSTAPLEPGEQLDIVVLMPLGSVDVPEPVLQPRAMMARLFSTDDTRVGGALLVSLLGLAGVGALAKRGRDEATPAGVGGVEYRPPLGLRPAQLRTLLNQRVDGISISATVVDLAVRGHLRIEEVEPTGLLSRFKQSDWRLVRTLAPDDELRPFERRMLIGLFGAGTLALEGVDSTAADPTLPADPVERTERERAEERRAGLDAGGWPPVMAGFLARAAEVGAGIGGAQRSVLVSSLGNGNFATHASAVEKQLYGDVVARGFFRRRPDHVRARFMVLSALVFLAGIGGLVLGVVQNGDWGLVVAPLVVVGVLMLIVARWSPRRTARGAEANARAKGFREFVRTAEAERMDFAEREQIFAAYLPYAMVFDCVDRWAAAFAALGVAAPAAAGGWYAGGRTTDVRAFSKSMSTFATTTGATMRQTASSSGSSGSGGGGSSGGGGGGGGGGRW